MSYSLETFGNASLQLFVDGAPLLVTDPWLVGSAYFGSWALDHPPGERQIANAAASPFVWISHGHPDHLHEESLGLLRRGQHVLLPDHWSPAIRDHLVGRGFRVTVMRGRRWTEIAPGVRVLCLEHENQDAILVVEAGDALVIDRNDCPLYGERRFLRRLVRRHAKSYLLGICSVDADMRNFVDAQGRRDLPPPDELKPGAVWDLGDLCTLLGVTHACSSSSQHVYVRSDSAWANEYRIGWSDLRRHWNAPRTALVPPFVTLDLHAGTYVENHPSQSSNWAALTHRTGDDDWSEPASEADWSELRAYFESFELLPRRVDFLRVTVAGETRAFPLSRRARRRPDARRRGPRGLRGLRLEAPRRSLMEAVRSGYVDDLLIGNFARVELLGARMYPDFTPIVAKLGGNAGVRTRRAARRLAWSYFRRAPRAWLADRLHDAWSWTWKPRLGRHLRRLRFLEIAKRMQRRLLGLPPLPTGSLERTRPSRRSREAAA